MNGQKCTSFLFVGNRAQLVFEQLKDIFQLPVACHHVSFSGASPVIEAPHSVWVDEHKFEYFGDYEQTPMLDWMKKDLELPFELSSIDYIVCDPTEVFSQAFVAFLVEKTNLELVIGKMTHSIPQLWLYPMGMPGYNVRLEMSSLLHFLKTEDHQVVLMRNDQSSMHVLLFELMEALKIKNLNTVVSEWAGLEILIGKNKKLVNG